MPPSPGCRSCPASGAERRRADRARRRPAEVTADVDESETISRTLLLAQRTADTTVAEAQAEADRLLGAARDDAGASLDAARAEAAQMVEDAKADARQAGEAERVQVEGEVQALLARRDFLESDVDHLEQYLVAQRERIVEVAGTLNDLVQRVPGGLGRHAPAAAVGRRRRPRRPSDADVTGGVDAADARDRRGRSSSRRSTGRPMPGPATTIDEHDEIAEIARIAGEDRRTTRHRSATLGDEQPSPSTADDRRTPLTLTQPIGAAGHGTVRAHDRR